MFLNINLNCQGNKSSVALGRICIKSKNKRGPRTDPCGTLHVCISLHDEISYNCTLGYPKKVQNYGHTFS